MENLDCFNLAVRISRLLLRLKHPPRCPDYENSSRAPYAVRVGSDTDSGLGSPTLVTTSPTPPSCSPALLSSPPLSPYPRSHSNEELVRPKESLSPSSPTAPGRDRVPLFSVNSQDCSSTLSMVTLNIPLRPSTSPLPTTPPPSHPPSPTPPLPPKSYQQGPSPPLPKKYKFLRSIRKPI